MCPPPPKKKPPVYYGYPLTGGLWVLELVHKKEMWREGMGKIQNAFTMDEKSKAIERMGGLFYQDPDEYWEKQEKQNPLTSHKNFDE
jgi:hypothetical protein